MVAQEAIIFNKRTKSDGQLRAVFLSPQKFLINLATYDFRLKSEKVNSIARLIKTGVPTVPLPHVLLPKSYLYYLNKKRLHPKAIKELKLVFNKIKKAGYTLALRPSIYAPQTPGFEFIVPNKINLPRFWEVKKAISNGYQKILKVAKRPEKVEFAYLVQGFYSGDRVGLLYTDDGYGNIHIEGVFGEHSKLITRGEVAPDVYRVDKKLKRIKEIIIAEKDFTLEPSKTGLKRVKLLGNKRKRRVLTQKEIKTLVKYALLLEKTFGPQEVEWTRLRSGQLIFQGTRTSSIKEKLKPKATKNIPIYNTHAKGTLLLRKKRAKARSLDNFNQSVVFAFAHHLLTNFNVIRYLL